MTVFQYHNTIIEQFPHTVGGIILAENIQIGDATALVEAYDAEQKAVIEKIGSKPLSEIDSLAAWRRTFRGFNVNPTKYRSAPEALLRRLTKKGDIPHINPLVDIGNLISIWYALPIAVFDLTHVQGAITVHLADGSEHYKELGNDETLHPEVGEVVFSDEKKMVVARRWCWRQSAESAAQATTSNALITIEAQHEGGRGDVESALNDFLEVWDTYVMSSTQHAILDGTNTAFGD